MHKRVVAAIGVALLIVLTGSIVYRTMFDEELSELSSPIPALAPDTTPTEAESERLTEIVQDINVVGVEGTVQRRKGQAAWQRVERGDAIRLDDSIRTEEGGRAVVHIGSTAAVELDGNSTFTVKDASSTAPRVRVDEGRVSATVHGQDGSKLIVEAQGSDAMAESEQGQFSLLTDGHGRIALATEKGRVVLSAKDQQVVVTDGMQSTVQPNLPPSKPQSIPTSLFLKVGKPRSRVTRSKATKISGTTVPGAVVSVNEVRLFADQSGEFSGTIPLKEGRNRVSVGVRHVTGMATSQELPPITVDTRPPKVRSTVQWGKETTGSRDVP